MELFRAVAHERGDLLGEWFENEGLKAALASEALTGCFAGPLSPGTGTNLLFHACLSGVDLPGGPAALTRALEKAARAAGVEIRTQAPVVGILYQNGRAAGVRLAGGEEIPARVTASSIDPPPDLPGTPARRSRAAGAGR